jgi:GT2 family glycosyltransferase
MAPVDARVSAVVLTHDRADELARTLHRLEETSPRPKAIIVVDNASSDGTAERLAREFPRVERVRCATNLGAAGRNAGVARVATPYVAFCDDDCWWTDGALARAADLLDAHSRLAAVAARVLVGPEERLDPTCAFMAASPLDANGLPGPALIGFMAGAVVLRAAAYREAGGYEPRLLIGAEEALLGLELAERGWHMAYCAEVIAQHHPSAARDPRQRQVLLARNRLWIAWLRLSPAGAWRETRAALRAAHRQRVLVSALQQAIGGGRWVAKRRRVVAPAVERMYLQVHAQAAR